MSFLLHPALRCPLDQLPLEQQDNSLRCGNLHSFDIARQGYVNLLAAQDKRSRDPGDSKAMIAARHDFLERSFYQPIAAQLNQLCEPLLGAGTSIVDAGCGEGYYLQQLLQHLEASGKPLPAVLGFDISKWAVQAAARRFAATWLVASNRQIPLAAESVDVALSLFGFPDFHAFARILKPGATLLLVSAGPRHLLELREVIYPEVRQSTADHTEAAAAAGFAAATRSELSYKIEAMPQTAIGQLLAMTPHLFRASSEGKLKAAALTELSLSVEVVFDVLVRH